MKIAVIGYSGSGKSTLARKLGEIYSADVLHFDRVQFLPNWEVRPFEEKLALTQEFLDSHTSWVIDGNYSKLFYDRRMAEADIIISLRFSRISCLFRAHRRYRKYKNTTRPDMGDGCNEKFDLDFVKWLLIGGRSGKEKARRKETESKYGEKLVVIRNQRQLDAFLNTLPLPEKS